MALRRTNSFYGLGQLREELDRHFSTLVENLPSVNSRTFPAVNVWEENDNLHAEAEVPGMTVEDFSISVVGRELTISGERKDRGDESTTYHRRERGTGPFTRVIRLPFDVDSSRVEANLRDGVLQITLPKSEAAKPRKIQVNAEPSA
jgi:HSP20 family protein